MQIIVYCENCGKKLKEERANAFYRDNNYLIVCDKCFETLKEVNNGN